LTFDPRWREQLAHDSDDFATDYWQVHTCHDRRYYVHIESVDFEVETWATAEIGTYSLVVLSHDEMPVSYRLERDNYTLRAELNLRHPTPQVTLTASDARGSLILLYGSVDDYCVGRFYDERHHTIPDWSPKASITYKWLRSGTAECQDTVLVVGQSLGWNIDVVDKSGKVVGEEVISFRVQQNGSYIRLDSI
jgi:hypothetical protein